MELNDAVKKVSFRKDQISSEKSELEIQQMKVFFLSCLCHFGICRHPFQRGDLI